MLYKMIKKLDQFFMFAQASAYQANIEKENNN